MNNLFLLCSISLISLSPVSAIAEDLKGVRDTAKQITVLIEGATQGSGAIISNNQGSYTVLTAWHVLSSNKEGEDVDIITHDSIRHKGKYIKKTKSGVNLDIGTIQFTSSNTYMTAIPAQQNQGSINTEAFVSGFPMPEFNDNKQKQIMTKGEIIANASVRANGGYQLLYTTPTWPGMSGGPVLNSNGEIIGIHGKARSKKSTGKLEGLRLSNGINEAVPIRQIMPKLYPKKSIYKKLVVDDYILLARHAADRDKYGEVIFFARKANTIFPTHTAYTLIAFGFMSQYFEGDDENGLKTGIKYAEKSIKMQPRYNFSHLLKCSAHVAQAQDNLAIKSCNDYLKYAHKAD